MPYTDLPLQFNMASTATSQFHSHSNTLQQPLLPRPCSVHRVVPTSGPPGTLFMIFLSVAEPCPAHITLSIDGQPVEVTATYHPVLKNQWVLHAFVPSSPASKGAGGHAVVVLRLSDGGNYHLDFRYELAAPAIPASTSCATIDPYHLLLSPLPPLPPHSPASLLPLPLPPSTYSSLPCYPPTPQRSCVFSIPLSSINSVSPKIGSISSGKRVKPSTHITAEDEQDPGANKFQRREWKRGYDIRTDIDYPSPGLDLQTPLFDMTNNWTAKELSAGRRLVRFSWDVKGTLIQASCAPVSQEEYHPNDLVISCIRRQEDERLPTEHLVTSCDVLYIAQRLLGVLFDTEEENRVRRNIQSIECATISNVRDLGTCESFPRSRNEKKNTSRTGIARSKNHDDSFFTRVMMYPNPKPRHIRKSFKVYRWEDLSKALGMIFNKYFCVKIHPPLTMK
ncbi:hypothetical protein BDQ17DRAFT_505279 [Cyathus striatus]|nr:hypothetical protein BDQ17DRAFT_505279 [Cyathus striatus]